LAIREDGVSEIQVGELLGQDLRIPNYQRPYSWEPATALQLLDDIRGAFDDGKRRGMPVRYAIGAVILHCEKDGGGGLDVVDGQQRLLTLKLMLAILAGTHVPSSQSNAGSAVSRVREALSSRVKHWSPERRKEFGAFVRERCQLVRIVTDDLDEAFRVFDSQNYRGLSLDPHDLLKAHHLREMRGDTEDERASIVETWEAVPSTDLDRLFSTYLYRIARWSRGENAPGFTIHDIAMFKGLSPVDRYSPVGGYHFAAQTALSAEARGSERNALRSRFQLDAPLVAGRPFFEMVTFMLAELKRLRQEAYPEEWNEWASSSPNLKELPAKSRYRYVSELYLAALLYCTNKFGGEDRQDGESIKDGESIEGGGNMMAIRERLFVWAYTLRVELLRVQFRSIDNRGSSRDADTVSAFVLLRDAQSSHVVHKLSRFFQPKGERHESDLACLLTRLA